MKRTTNNLIGFLCGVALSAVSYYLKSYTEYYFIPLIIGAVFALFCLLSLLGDNFSKKRSIGRQDYPEPQKIPPKYERKNMLLSRSEADFFDILNGLFGEKYWVFPQVALAAVIDKLTQNSYRNELFRVADFCIAHKITYAPLVLIELNDASHNRPDRIERDKRVAEICASAGMPLVTIKTSEAGDAKEIYKLISKKMLKK